MSGSIGVGGGREKIDERWVLEVGKRIGSELRRNLYIDAKEPDDIC
jgi:hypothetical protein